MTAGNITGQVRSRSGEQYAIHEKHMNFQLARVLKTIEFNVDYARGKGQYLWDQENNRYLDMLSGFGVFALGRYHPRIVGAIKEVMDMEAPTLVQMDCSLLSGLLAEKLLALLPDKLNSVYFTNSGAESVEAAIKFARAFTKREKCLHLDHSFHGFFMNGIYWRNRRTRCVLEDVGRGLFLSS